MDAQGLTSPILCRKAISKIFKWRKQGIKRFCNKHLEKLEIPIIDLVRENFPFIFEMAITSGTRIVIIEKQASHMNRLLVDFRHMTDRSFTQNVLFWVIDINTKALVLETIDLQDVPNVRIQNKGIFPKVFKDGEEPQTLQELRITLEKYNILKDTFVWYEHGPCNGKLMPWLVENPTFEAPKYEMIAYTKSDLSIGYKMKKKKVIPMSKKAPTWMTQSVEEELPSLHQGNRRSSVHLKLEGLNLALCLNEITRAELGDLGHELSKMCGAVWLTFDNLKHLRHMVYYDSQGSELYLEFRCKEPTFNDIQWKSFFNHIEKRGKKMEEEKNKILQPVMAKLEPYFNSYYTNEYEKCYKQLKLFIKKHKIFTFCNDDTTLHAIKGPLAGWGGEKQGKVFGKGVYLKTMANYSVTALYNPIFIFINLSGYFNYQMQIFDPSKDDEVLWKLGEEWFSLTDVSSEWPSPNVTHSIVTLRYQEKVRDKIMKKYLDERGCRNAILIKFLWESFASHYTCEYDCDVTSTLHFSISRMAFTIVWNKLRGLGGPLYHSIEQMHPHTEYTLRPFCKGGFSYSCRDKVVQNEPLGEGMENASSIKEYDLTSSYGFSGKTMAASKGFGVIFTPEHGRVGRRHVSYEYMSVMYAIHRSMEVRPIHSVYSNYSALGNFYVKKYPIDLVVIFQDGGVELVQFDGHYVHGDYRNPNCSPDKTTYVNGKTRQECEEKTKERDQHIYNWMCHMNQRLGYEKFSYHVMSDCCSNNFTKAKLVEAFRTIPELMNLVSGMESLNGSLDNVDLNDYTFYAIIHGRCTQNLKSLGPIFTNDLDNPTMFEGRMLLTSDYYDYLKVNYGLQVDSIEWIVYYKRCHDLPKVFEQLLELRQEFAEVKSKSGIVKSIINYACGYFGLNSDKSLKTLARVSHTAPKKMNIHIHTIEPIQEVCNGFDIVIVKTARKPKGKRYSTTLPFVLFVGIVEYGKLRLNKALQCLQTYLRPTSFRLLYSNVDNLVFALSTNSFEEAIIDPFDQILFELEWNSFSGSKPGQLKLEWDMRSDTDWKFVSPMRMFYCVTSGNPNIQGHSKTCAYKGLESQKAFDVAVLKLNNMSAQIEQMRRVDKLAGIAMKQVTYNC